jgi:hypothetical protein
LNFNQFIFLFEFFLITPLVFFMFIFRFIVESYPIKKKFLVTFPIWLFLKYFLFSNFWTLVGILCFILFPNFGENLSSKFYANLIYNLNNSIVRFDFYFIPIIGFKSKHIIFSYIYQFEYLLLSRLYVYLLF